MKKDLLSLQTSYLQKITQAQTLQELDEIFLELFGKKGKITLLSKNFPTLSYNELKTITPVFNQTKIRLDAAIETRRYEIKETKYQALINEKIDITTPANIKLTSGHLHPITKFIKEIENVFAKIGFQRFEAPYIDSDYYNFEALNIPPNHPARDLWDTLYINSNTKTQVSKLLLRTHTSNSQLRMMEQYRPPIKLMNIGTCFRYENVDARHEHTFEQFELVYIDKGVNMANLQYLSEYFLQAILGQDIKARLRPKYYPFVEPGAGVDGLCIFCKGKGCRVCGETGWLELAGAGMIHPKVLTRGGVDPKIYSGIAWGFGPERMIMLKYGINDIRLFRNGDLKFLEKF